MVIYKVYIVASSSMENWGGLKVVLGKVKFGETGTQQRFDVTLGLPFLSDCLKVLLLPGKLMPAVWLVLGEL